jgi:hypothetical protein
MTPSPDLADQAARRAGNDEQWDEPGLAEPVWSHTAMKGRFTR